MSSRLLRRPGRRGRGGARGRPQRPAPGGGERTAAAHPGNRLTRSLAGRRVPLLLKACDTRGGGIKDGRCGERGVVQEPARQSICAFFNHFFPSSRRSVIPQFSLCGPKSSFACTCANSFKPVQSEQGCVCVCGCTYVCVAINVAVFPLWTPTLCKLQLVVEVPLCFAVVVSPL